MVLLNAMNFSTFLSHFKYSPQHIITNVFYMRRRRNPLMVPKRFSLMNFFMTHRYIESESSRSEYFHKHNWDNLDDDGDIEGGILLN